MSTKSPAGRQETILLVEDDLGLRLAMTKTLRSEGFRVEIAGTGKDGLEAALAQKPDLVLLDVMLPGMNGFEVCQRLREADPEVPILMVTAKGEEPDKVRGLRLGADDYIVKPFGVAELCARIDAALRRRRRAEVETEVLQIGDITADFRAHTLRRKGQPLETTALEMRLLRYFLRHEGTLLPRQRILDAVWGADYFGTDRTVDNFINRLRAKIEDDPKNPRHLVTVRGAGYRFTRAPSTGGD
ncbi:response regulator transcription factor [Polyangium mundeleinium]|uniref:Response regulator transcription factor n=1 Tax=Polyangium mundeleinium TaxID=2995306 RepID=A0ABT5ESE4_9BACT|nr:response regulator transcription factor [Polyangium mundeleinium]MDC0743847.1 response regulator transcription factor [Polyangium mundeleinium]